MALLALVILLIIVFVYDVKMFVYALMVFYVLFDMLDGFYDDEKIFAAIRYIIPLCLLIFFIIKESAFKKSDFIFVALFFYLLVLLVYSTQDIIMSGKTVLAVLITLIMIPVGRRIGEQFDFLDEFSRFNRFLLYALPIYILLANVFHIGAFFYSESFTTGYLITSRMYVIPIVVFISIHYLLSGHTKSTLFKGLDITFILINVAILIINTRRTTFGMLVLSLLVYAALNRQLIFKMVIAVLLSIMILIFSYPLYEEALTAQLAQRERIQNFDTYEEEGRVLETLYIMDYHSSSQKISEILFGVKLFDTIDFGVRYFGDTRSIHSDINMIFYSTGIVGMCLFAAFFLHYFFMGIKKIYPENRKIYFPILIIFLTVLLPGRFIGTLTYAPMLMLLLAAVKAGRPKEEIESYEPFTEGENDFIEEDRTTKEFYKQNFREA